jgi:uncharacterized protein
MSKIDTGLVSKAKSFVMELLDKRLSEGYLFHSKKHTLDVLNNSVMIGRNCGLTEHELNILKVSALFHDVGYIRNFDDHESESSSIAGEFLRGERVDEPEISCVCEAILATRVPQQPRDRISEVLCDADLMHLTSVDYFEQMELLRLEWLKTGRYNLTEYQFHLNSIDFFSRHHYHSAYGRLIMESRKSEILKRISDRADSLKSQ